MSATQSSTTWSRAIKDPETRDETGTRTETFGHADAYWALDVDDREHAQRVIDALTPFSEARTLDWEWADPPLRP